MSITNKTFLLSKLNNLINWIEKDKLLPKNHELLLKLRSFNSKFDDMIQFISDMCKYSDNDSNIPTHILEEFLKLYNLSIISFKEDDLNKLNRYFKCFIKIAKQN